VLSTMTSGISLLKLSHVKGWGSAENFYWLNSKNSSQKVDVIAELSVGKGKEEEG